MEPMEWDDDCMSFWQHNSNVFDKPFMPALRALSDASIQICY